MKDILVPTDFSEPAKAALEYAVTLAKQLGAPIHVVHSYELPLIGFPDGVVTITAEMASRIIDDAQRGLREIQAEYAKRGVTMTTSLVQADPRSGILEEAKKRNAEMIVIGTHGRRGFARALMGSVAEAVVRTSSIPVLTVRHP